MKTRVQSNKRAVDESLKKMRHQDILDAAGSLLGKYDFNDITITKIAAKSKLANGTLFLYFQSKEDIFLTLTEQEVENWSLRTEKLFNAYIGTGNRLTPTELVSIIIDSLDNSILVKLFAILDDTLERNISHERALQFKTSLKIIMFRLGSLIGELLPLIDTNDGITILNHLYVCLIGSYKVSNPSEIIRTISKNPGMEIFDRKFKETLTAISTCYIEGFIALKK